MDFPPLGNSGDVAVSVSINFPSNSQRHAWFHCIAYNFSRANWDDDLRDHLRYVPWKDMLLLLLVDFVSGFNSISIHGKCGVKRRF